MFENLLNFVAGGGHSAEETTNTDAARRRNSRRLTGSRGNGNTHQDGHVDNKINDMLHIAQTEERVSRYLEQIQQDHATGRFQRLDTDKSSMQKQKSWEYLHKPKSHNRHVYFGGAPLGQCIEIINMKRREAVILKEKQVILKELEDREAEIDELMEKQTTDFQKFEVALGKALGLGGGCAILADLLNRHCTKMMRQFFKRMRRKQIHKLEGTIERQAEIIRQKHKLAVMVIARMVDKSLLTPMKEALVHWRCSRGNKPMPSATFKGFKYAEVLKGEKPAMKKSWKRGSNKPTENLASVEESLLTRLENLVAEEMQMLTTTRLVEP
ncbi:hypothetical protein BBOV_III011260 [Babesia bovis T2Bo]|uniref:hypothetical protein n=1 Tax=Babesia bovis T2Bo TaxID=484906 RepID=UPI001C3688BC|nr:hypothetical protein BBOV_III011260 [Babesia bovis T2Bo]EDO08678.2 hypothetical protein BBOV_III011260 [Babesia bovis T2Bo]